MPTFPLRRRFLFKTPPLETRQPWFPWIKAFTGYRAAENLASTPPGRWSREHEAARIRHHRRWQPRRQSRDTVSLVRDRPWSDGLPPGGRLIVQGRYSKDVPFPQDIAFTKELQIFWPRDCQRSDLESVFGYLASGTDSDGTLHANMMG